METSRSVHLSGCSNLVLKNISCMIFFRECPVVLKQFSDPNLRRGKKLGSSETFCVRKNSFPLSSSSIPHMQQMRQKIHLHEWQFSIANKICRKQEKTAFQWRKNAFGMQKVLKICKVFSATYFSAFLQLNSIFPANGECCSR